VQANSGTENRRRNEEAVVASSRKQSLT
jgi:hypothetical protein